MGKFTQESKATALKGYWLFDYYYRIRNKDFHRDSAGK
jgi:hypothetical protein